MEEALLAYGPAILAVAVAAFLRMRTSRREARAEVVAFQKKLAAIKQRRRQLEQDRGQSGASELPEQQCLVLTADRDFKLSRVGYVSDWGTTVNLQRIGARRKKIDWPPVNWTQAEKEFADEVIQRFFDEDR
jgi:hypothetical protein